MLENKLNALRADQIAKEFNVSFIIKGNGDEYQRINEIRATRSPLILPVNFPKPYDVDDPNDADQISTTDLMHWELAPFNAGIVANYQIPFAITSNGCETAKMFLHNLRKAVSKGLDEKVALQALTTSPARFMKIESQTGSLKNGMLANFIIADGNLFKTESRVLELWTLGKRHVANEPEEPSIEGVFDIKSASLKGYSLSHSNGAKNTLLYSGDDTLKLHLKREKSYYLLQPKLPKSTDKIVNLIAWADETDSSVFPYRVNVIKGNITLPDGATEIFTATLSKPVTRSEKKDSISQDSLPSILYPFTDYGKPTDTQAETIVFKNATLWTNEGDGIVSESDLAIKDGKIIAIGKNLKIVSAKEIDATGRHLTSGIIDEHSHIAINNGVNENAQAVTSEVRVGDVINSEDLNIYRQLAGGVTASQLLHGSANPIGGQSALVKLRWGASPEQMKIEGADGFIKFALGENVKQSNWGDRATTRYPQTRMGVEQVLMDAFTRANEYSSAWRKNPRIRRDLELDALVEVLTKKRFITCHSYVQSEINLLMHIADSFGFKVNTFTHILEGYKVADKIKSHGANASTFADWWAYKMEVVDAIPYNASIMHKMGINTAINSDDAEMGRRLNQEAAKIVKYGNVNEEDAWKMVTLNPAKMLHLDKRMGSLAVGKDADIVLWSEHPLSIYAKPEYTFVDGRCLYSIEQDKKLREANNKIRQRIILKMIAAKRKGEPSEKYVSVPEEIYHCKD